MKKLLLPALVLLLVLSACSYMQKEVVPEGLYTAPQMTAADLQKASHVEVSRYGFRLLTIPISMPDPNAMIADAIRTQEGQGITNLEVEFSEFNIILFQIPKIRIIGDIVK